MARRIFRRIEIGEYVIPDEALRLSEDICRMESVLDLLAKIDPASLSNSPRNGYFTRRRLIAVVAAWKTFANNKLSKTYLGGKQIKRKPNPTDAEVWLMLINDLKISLNDEQDGAVE